eukprot:6409716-Lingulodinium_polyedra.AAC.1
MGTGVVGSAAPATTSVVGGPEGDAPAVEPVVIHVSGKWSETVIPRRPNSGSSIPDVVFFPTTI